MRASELEFRRRGWFFFALFLLTFGSYALQPVNSAEWLLRVMGRAAPSLSVPTWGGAGRCIFAVGALLIGLGAWLRTWGTAYLHNEVVRDKALHADRLVADGPYRFVRNPLYLGNILLAIGLAPMASPLGAAVLVGGMVFLVLRLIGREEAALLEKQGEAYREYFAQVPRLWPALRPRVPRGLTEPRWGQAWAAEIWMWILAVAVAVFAITLEASLFDDIVWSGLAVYFLLRAWMVRRVRPRSAG